MNADAKLYHGSAFFTKELKPGFYFSKKLVEWDKTESNKFLYATTEYRDAVLFGFASLIEKRFDVEHVHFDSNKDSSKVYVATPEKSDKLSVEDLLSCTVYLYTINHRKSDGWQLVKNKVNNYDKEFKTSRFIEAIEKIEEIVIKDWFESHGVLVDLVNSIRPRLSLKDSTDSEYSKEADTKLTNISHENFGNAFFTQW